MKALQNWLEHNVRGETWGIYRCENGSRRGNYSLHSEGRAIDWHLDAGVAKENRAAQPLHRHAAGAPTATATSARSPGAWGFRA